MINHELLKDYSIVIEIPVAWGDMDAFQHVNNTVYFRYFESARVAYFEKINFIQWMKETGVGPILAKADCRFRVPLTYPDTVLVGAKIVSIDEDRFVMKCAIVSLRHQKIAAEGEGTIVCYNFRELKKAPIPEEIRKALSQ